MVRIKHRYLLLNILYPDPPTSQHTSQIPPPTQSTLPDIVQFHQPTPDDITPQILARAIKDQIAQLYGDYGVGVTADGLMSEFIYLLEQWKDYLLECWIVYLLELIYLLTYSLTRSLTHSLSSKLPNSHKFYSKIPFSRNLNGHNPMFENGLQARLGCAFLHDALASYFSFPEGTAMCVSRCEGFGDD